MQRILTLLICFATNAAPLAPPSERAAMYQKQWQHLYEKAEKEHDAKQNQQASQDFLTSAEFAFQYAAQNDMAAKSIEGLGQSLFDGGDYANASECFKTAFLLYQVLERNNSDMSKLQDLVAKSEQAAGPTVGDPPIRQKLAGIQVAARSKDEEFEAWTKIESSSEDAIKSGDYATADRLIAKAEVVASGYKPALNVPFLATKVIETEQANFHRRSNTKDLLRDVDEWTQAAVAESNELRRRIKIVKARQLLASGKTDQASKMIDQAQDGIHSARDNAEIYAECYTVRAAIQEAAQDLQAARESVRQSTETFENAGLDTDKLAEAQLYLGRIERDEKHYDLSAKELKKGIDALTKASSKKNPALAPLYFELALTYIKQSPQKLADAQTAAKQALDLAKTLYDKGSRDLNFYDQLLRLTKGPGPYDTVNYEKVNGAYAAAHS